MKLIGVIIFGLILVHDVLGIKLKQQTNYEIQMDHLEIINSPNGNSFNFSTLRITKFNRTCYVAKANIVQLAESTSDIEVEVKVNQMQGNVYRQSPFKIAKQPICAYWKTAYKLYIYEALKNFSNFAGPDECPFPKREYWVKDYVFDSSNSNLPPYIPLTKFRIDTLFYENNVKSGGIMAYGETVKPGL